MGLRQKMSMYKIYKPSKSSMQSGVSNTSFWIIESLEVENKTIDSRFCWRSSTNTLEQIKLKFKTLKDAVSYANKQKLMYRIEEPKKQKKFYKSYADNFKPKKDENLS